MKTMIAAGSDPQLEKAVEVLLQQRKKNPPPVHRRPAYPNYHRWQWPIAKENACGLAAA